MILRKSSQAFVQIGFIGARSVVSEVGKNVRNDSELERDLVMRNSIKPFLERALKISDDFGKIAGLSLNVKKTKAIWLGKWANNKNKPLNLKWLHSPVKILGIHFSYDEKRNNELNFMQKVQRLQTKLDMWSARDLTIFGRAILLKTLGLSQLVYSASNLVVPPGIVDIVRTNLLNFSGKIKMIKLKDLAFIKNQIGAESV